MSHTIRNKTKLLARTRRMRVADDFSSLIRAYLK
jgi:hypothetical protein